MKPPLSLYTYHIDTLPWHPSHKLCKCSHFLWHLCEGPLFFWQFPTWFCFSFLFFFWESHNFASSVNSTVRSERRSSNSHRNGYTPSHLTHLKLVQRKRPATEGGTPSGMVWCGGNLMLGILLSEMKTSLHLPLAVATFPPSPMILPLNPSSLHLFWRRLW